MSCPTCGSVTAEVRYIVWRRYEHFVCGRLTEGAEGAACCDPFHRVASVQSRPSGWPDTLRLEYEDAKWLKEIGIAV